MNTQVLLCEAFLTHPSPFANHETGDPSVSPGTFQSYVPPGLH